MLAVSPLRDTCRDENQGEVERFDLTDFGDGNQLDSIDFDDLFIGINDGDVLPDLEMDPEILAEFSASGGEESEINTSLSAEKLEDNRKREEDDKVSGSGSASSRLNSSRSSRGEDGEIVSKREERVAVSTNNTSQKEEYKGRKSSTTAQSKNSQGKRKVKVITTS